MLSQGPGGGRQTKLSDLKNYIPKHAPYTHNPTPRSSSSRLVRKKEKQSRFMEKCLKGEKAKREKEGTGESESHKIWNNSIGIFHVYAR